MFLITHTHVSGLDLRSTLLLKKTSHFYCFVSGYFYGLYLMSVEL